MRQPTGRIAAALALVCALSGCDSALGSFWGPAPVVRVAVQAPMPVWDPTPGYGWLPSDPGRTAPVALGGGQPLPRPTLLGIPLLVAVPAVPATPRPITLSAIAHFTGTAAEFSSVGVADGAGELQVLCGGSTTPTAFYSVEAHRGQWRVRRYDGSPVYDFYYRYVQGVGNLPTFTGAPCA